MLFEKLCNILPGNHNSTFCQNETKKRDNEKDDNVRNDEVVIVILPNKSHNV
jgi:hypothetical protein